MNILLEQKYHYEVFENKDNIKERLKEFLDLPWYDLSINLTGKLKEDGTFILKPKMTLLAIDVFNMAQSLSSIEGKFVEREEITVIEVLLRPNYLILFCIYLFLVIVPWMMINQLYTDLWFLFIVLGTCLIIIACLIGLILFSQKRLLKRFEQVIEVFRPDKIAVA